MACAIARSTLAEEQALLLRRLLTIYPKVNERYGKEVTPLTFYTLDDQYAHIPYMVAATFLQTPLQTRPYTKYPFLFTGQLRAEQEPIAGEAWSWLISKGTVTLGLPPSSGKTVYGAYLSAHLSNLTVVLVPTSPLINQWAATYQKVTNAVTWRVGEEPQPEGCQVIICLDKRAEKIPPELRDKVGTLIIDEAHLFCTPGHVPCLLTFHPQYIIAETATMERENEMHVMMHALVGTHGVYRQVQRHIHVTKVLTGIKPLRKNTDQGRVDWAALTQSLYYHEGRNRLIVDIIKANHQFKIMVLAGEVEHVKLLHDLLKQEGVEADYLCGSKSSYNDSSVLVGTDRKIGTGFDEATACANYRGRPSDLVIICNSIKKVARLIQNAGRGFRADKVNIMHLIDDDSILESHWKGNEDWYRSVKATIVQAQVSLS